MRLSSTSTERTYRYVRISIVGAVVAMGVALVAVLLGDGPVTSLSALFYTSGRTVFTGALFAIALALLALSGHSVEQVLLDLAAVFALLVAVVPTPVIGGDAPGGRPLCPGLDPCVPPADLPGVRVGVVTVAVVVVLGAAAAVILARIQRIRIGGVLAAAAAAIVVVTGAVVWMLTAPDSLLAGGHLAATSGFFGLMAAVAVVSAVTSHDGWRRLYLAVAVGMSAFLLFLAAVMAARLAGVDQTGQPWILAGEGGLVVSFAVFWMAQTVQKWRETDPALVGR
jgi:hypothetical protein